jgi:hypothetical protein
MVIWLENYSQEPYREIGFRTIVHLYRYIYLNNLGMVSVNIRFISWVWEAGELIYKIHQTFPLVSYQNTNKFHL